MFRSPVRFYNCLVIGDGRNSFENFKSPDQNLYIADIYIQPDPSYVTGYVL